MEEDLNYQVKLIERVKKELGISNAELAKKLKVGRSSISEWGNGKRYVPYGTLLAMKLMIENKRLKDDLKVVNAFSSLINRSKSL
jgi:DNA-binding XRE family transcriptional regulator